jgi:hypothetical protein
MDPNQLIPPALQRIGALVIFAESAFVISWHARIIGRAALRADLGDRARTRMPALVGVFLATWLAAALILGDPANFPLEHEGLRQLFSGLVALVPLLVAVVWLFASKTGGALNAATEPASLISIQFYRVAGAAFIFPYLAYGALPRGFALPAGIGDVLTGLFAPLVAWSVLRNRRGSRATAVAWNIFGILDLLVAPMAAIFSGARILEMFPLSLVPLFVGPPLGILTHIYSLRNLTVNRGRRLEVPSGEGIPRPAESQPLDRSGVRIRHA